MPDVSVKDLIRQEAKKAGIPVPLAFAVAEQESGLDYNPTLIGKLLPSGEQAIGTFQLLPSTAKSLGKDPRNPFENIQGGTQYLRQLMDQHQGDLNKVLAAYGGVRTDTTYVPAVLEKLKKYQALEQQAGGTPSRATPGAGQPPPEPPEPGFWSSAYHTFDPFTPQGRKNFGGAAGALIGSVALSPSVLGTGPVGPFFGGLGGAALGGAAAEGVNQLIAGFPQGAGGTVGEMAGAGTEQGMQEVAGHAIMYPFQVAGKAFIASKVATDAAAHLNKMREALDAMLAQAKSPVQPAQAGRMMNKVIQGPAKTTLSGVGAQAEAAAASSGVTHPTQPLLDELARLSEQITPSAAHAPTAATLGGPPLPPDHPLPALLSKIETILKDSGPEISLLDEHKIKRALDETVNWESPAKKQVAQLTKAFRQLLREQMEGHAPYDVPTAEYAEKVKLFTKGIAPKLKRGLIDNPEQIVKLIRGDSPTRLQMLRDLMGMAQQSGGGQRASGAWDAVRDAWTNTHLVSGDITELGARLKKMDPDFERLMFDGPAGQQQLANLKAIAQGYEDNVAQEAAFKGSSLSNVRSKAEVARDIGHMVLPTHPHTKVVAAGRLLLFGATAKDLVQWASNSGWKTRLLVKALTSDIGGDLTADLIRIYDADQRGEPPLVASHEPTGGVAEPPPAPGGITITGLEGGRGGPPPAPPQR